MKLRPNKRELIVWFFLLIIMTSMSLLLFSDLDGDRRNEKLSVAIIGTLLFLLCLINELINACRSYILDENGCTMRFLWYKKRYLWEEFNVKEIFYTDYVLRHRNYELGSVHFQKCKHPNSFMSPKFHPFSYLAIEFSGEAEKKRLRYRELYSYCTVEKEEFLEHMREWGVELKDKTPYSRRRIR